MGQQRLARHRRDIALQIGVRVYLLLQVRNGVGIRQGRLDVVSARDIGLVRVGLLVSPVEPT